MGKGSGGPSNTTVTNNNLPAYAEPYVKNALARSEAESKRPYQTYGNPRIANQSPDTLNAYQQLRDLSGSGLGGITNAMNIYGNVNGSAGGILGYNPQDITSNFSPQDINSQNVQAGQWDANTAQQYMNPYLDQVLGVQKNNALLDYQRMQGGRNDEAIQSGAFGDSRHGVSDALSQEALMRQVAEIDATGRNEAWNQAQGMFTSDRNAGLEAALGNQGSNLQAQLGTQAGQQFGAELFTGIQGQNEQFRQSANQMGLDALAAQLSSAQGLTSAQGQYDTQSLARANALATAGDKSAAYNQSLLDVGYNDFVNQRDSNRQNLQFLNSMLQGIPISANQSVSEYQTINPISQMMGLGLGGLGFMQMNGQQ